jgi:hypothetical protein
MISLKFRIQTREVVLHYNFPLICDENNYISLESFFSFLKSCTKNTISSYYLASKNDYTKKHVLSCVI